MTILPRFLHPLGVLALLALGACTHVKGQVLEERSKKPMTDAVFTVGRPDGVGVTSRHPVDSNGNFDFYIGKTEEEFLFVWDGKGDPLINVHKIEPAEINDHMRLYLPRSQSDF